MLEALGNIREMSVEWRRLSTWPQKAGIRRLMTRGARGDEIRDANVLEWVWNVRESDGIDAAQSRIKDERLVHSPPPQLFLFFFTHFHDHFIPSTLTQKCRKLSVSIWVPLTRKYSLLDARSCRADYSRLSLCADVSVFGKTTVSKSSPTTRVTEQHPRMCPSRTPSV